MSDWTVREAVREDEACIIPMWARQLVMGPDAAGAGHRWATRERGSAEYVAYYETHQPVLEGLLRSGARVLVACDPERSEYLPGAPAVIHAWSVVSGDVVYGVGIKRDAARAGFSSELARLVLGDALDRPMRTVLDIRDVRVPPHWRRERGWGSVLRQVSERTLSEDAVFLSVARHILDPERVPWVPSEERAA